MCDGLYLGFVFFLLLLLFLGCDKGGESRGGSGVRWEVMGGVC